MIQAARPPESQGEQAELDFQRLKTAIHEELVESLDLAMISRIEQERLAPEIRSVANQLVDRRSGQLPSTGQERMRAELMDEIFGLGPLERLMRDLTISDILVNNAHEVFIERRGRLEKTNVVFADDQHLLRVIQRIVSRIGRHIDETSPMVDARLPDGSRVNAIVPPLAFRGPTLSIRRFGVRPLRFDDLIANGSLLPPMSEFLRTAVQARMNLLVSGGTGSGKTTLLNAMAVNIPPEERLITIEDSIELNLQHPHVVQLETRSANTEGVGEVTQRSLFRNSLRMRPDRIVVGEVRGPEALDMLQAMNTGHDGSLTTIHANDTRDALARLEMMIAMTGVELPVAVARQYIAAGIHLVVQVARLKGGSRKVTRVTEIVGLENGVYRLEDLFHFEQLGVDADGQAVGRFRITGYRPRCLERFRASGIAIDESMFEPRTVDIAAGVDVVVAASQEK